LSRANYLDEAEDAVKKIMTKVFGFLKQGNIFAQYSASKYFSLSQEF